MENIRIHIDKEDELPVIAGKVFVADAKEVVIIVPKFSKLAESADGLKFLKKGLSGSRKTLVVESVDDKIISLAKKSKISASNPFFNSWEEKDEDIVLASKVGDDIFEKADRDINRSLGSRRGRRVFWPGILLALVVAAGGWAAYDILPRAEITITTEKKNWSFSGEMTVDKDLSSASAGDFKVPGQVFSQKKNLQMSFPASGKDFVSQKAAGKIIIYNGYSSQPQPLVASTRFETPDGKVFRINEAVTVPGAKIADGKIEPSAVEAAVTADKPGKEYNIGPVAKLTVPGFKGSPKFSGFYGEIKSPMIGGYLGETAMATAKDVASAKNKSVESIKNSLELLIASQLPDGFHIPGEAKNFKVVSEVVDVVANENNEFSVFIEAELSIIGFREEDALAVLSGRLKRELGDDYSVKSYEFNYDAGDGGFDGKRVKLAVDFSAVAEKPIASEELKKIIANKSEDDLRAMVFSLPGLKKAKVSLWPLWVNRVPENPEKIKIYID